MIYVLITNAAVSLIMGCALVMVWRQDSTQSFTFFIGWANLVQLLVPLTYLLRSMRDGAYVGVGNFALAGVAAVYSALLLAGTAQLANRAMRKNLIWLVLALLVAVNATAIGLGGPRLGQTFMALVNSGLGLV